MVAMVIPMVIAMAIPMEQRTKNTIITMIMKEFQRHFLRRYEFPASGTFYSNPSTDGIHQESNINLRAATLHVIGDLLASIGVLVSSIIIIVRPDMTIVDPICTFIFSILVLYTTYHLVKDSLAVLMEGTPLNIRPEAIEQSILEIPGVVAVHDLHVWNLSPGKSSLTAHITFDKNAMHTYDEILYQAQHIVCDKYGVHHTTLQLESDVTVFTSHCRPDLCAPSTN
jgi:cation diffusion facilitator family transporter